MTHNFWVNFTIGDLLALMVFALNGIPKTYEDEEEDVHGTW